jgi:NADPH:quinone reductase-like Zn-dependent oxidoreductase
MARAKKATAKQPAAKQPAAKKKTAAQKLGAAKVATGERQATFTALRKMLARHARDLVVVHDKADNYYLDCKSIGSNGKPLFFGAVQAKKSYVSLHLFPIYTDPGLCLGISPTLAKRKQGKSCFNFSALDPDVAAEVDALVGRSVALWKRLGRI